MHFLQIRVYCRVYLHPAQTEPLPPFSYYLYDLGISTRNAQKSPLLLLKTSKLYQIFVSILISIFRLNQEEDSS